jgi:hypothetical protein
MNPPEWKTVSNQIELDALFSQYAQYGEALKVRMVGEWDDVRIERRAMYSIDLYAASIRGTVYAAGALIGGTMYCWEARIGGSLILSGARIAMDIYAYEAYLGGSLDAAGADIGASVILDRARVGGAMTLSGARIGRSISVCYASIGGAVDASGAQIGGSLAYRNGLIRGGIAMPTVMHGVPGRAIAQCDGYILWLGEDGRYYDGCHGPYTAEEALEHWNRDDERARVFRAAIQAAADGDTLKVEYRRN